ncbi:MAG: hypothetical protein QF771_03820 [Candidatus Marinimicrobia bacterium]|nr:hypothetical protein [Candidatus Neomarinimicrobiota bacterium]
MSRKSISSVTRSDTGESTISNRDLLSNARIIYHMPVNVVTNPPSVRRFASKATLCR